MFLCLLISATVYGQKSLGDNLGTHIATDHIDMNNKLVYNTAGVVIGSAALVNSSVSLQIDGNKAILLPRVPTLAIITTPLNGMIVYLNSDQKFYVYQAGVWTTFATASLADGNIFIGNAAGTAVPVVVSGDLTISNTGVSSITAGAVLNSKVNNLAVTGAKIAPATLVTADFAPAAVTTALLADQAVTTDKIPDAAVSNVKIAATAVSAEHFSSTTQGNSKALVTNNLGNHEWINLSQILVPTLTTGRMIVANAAGIPTAVTMTGDVSITNTGVTTIKADGITSSHIADGTIVTADLANASVTASKISSSTAGNYKVMTTNNDAVAEWADQALVQGFVVGDIKPYFPGLMGTTVPANWLMCSGQTVTTTGSALLGKVLPNLNANTFLMGSKGTSGLTVGSNSVLISQANLPPVVPLVTSVGATEIIPAGTVTVNAAGSHTHTLNDPAHSHLLPFDGDENGANSGKVKSTDRRNSNTQTTSNTVPVLSATTNISVNNDGIHKHNAAFSNGNVLGSHGHVGMTSSSINGGVTQTAISNMPSSITVWWIIKVK